MKFNHAMVPVRDIAKARAFYLRLGFRRIVDELHYVRLQAPDGDATLSLHLTEDLPTGETPILYFECDDLNAIYEQLRAAGIAFRHPPKDQTWLWRETYCADPDGNRLCLYRAGKNRLDPPWKAKP